MLSDEEKKAIEIVKGLAVYYDDYGLLDEEEIEENEEVNNSIKIVLNLIEKQSKEIEELNLENIELKESKIVDKNSIKIVLNLIEKQSKEIEELNLENIELKQSKIVDKNSIPNQDNFYDCYNFIHKDKIKAKIDYLLKHYDSENFINFEMFIKILQSLLEKEFPTTITKEELEKRWKGVDICKKI